MMKTLRSLQTVVLGFALFVGNMGMLHADASGDFFVALTRNDAGAVKRLVRSGVSPNVRSTDGYPALFWAVRARSEKVVDVLLSTPGIDVNALSPQDESPLMMAAIQGNMPLVQRLLKMKAQVNKKGWAPLHYAASGGSTVQTDIVKLLLDHYAYIDTASPNGTTPLMMAAQYGTPESVRLLLDEGADPSLKNQQGSTALDFARRSGRQFVESAIAAAVRDWHNKYPKADNGKKW